VIIRVFRPTIRPGKEREFEAFLRDTAVPLVSQQSGLLAQHVGRPRDPSSTEYVYVTVWEDVESIRAFAGERWQQAVITQTRSTCSRKPRSGIMRSSRYPTTSVKAPTQPADCKCATTLPRAPGWHGQTAGRRLVRAVVASRVTSASASTRS
jgi:heme-degrading monooxygenase HmoA